LAQSKDRLLVGEIGAAQGLKGELRLRSYTQDPAAIASYGALEDENGQPIEIESLRVTPKALIVRIKGVATREAAEALALTKLYLRRELLPERGEDEWYHADLIGLAAVDKEGAQLGTVVAIQNFGAGDLIEVKPSGGGASVLVPFTQRAVPEVDLAQRRIVIVPPEETSPESEPDSEPDC
jgi:16S rRNA processing protein RimM